MRELIVYEIEDVGIHGPDGVRSTKTIGKPAILASHRIPDAQASQTKQPPLRQQLSVQQVWQAIQNDLRPGFKGIAA